MSHPAVVWFKKDFRTYDHLPLRTALDVHDTVLAVYVIEPELWQQPDSHIRHWLFIRDALAELKEELWTLRIPFVVFELDMLKALSLLKNTLGFSHLYSHEETGNRWSYQRDIKMKGWCNERSVSWSEFPTNGVVRCLKSRDDWKQIHDQRMQKPCLSSPQAKQSKMTIPTNLKPFLAIPSIPNILMNTQGKYLVQNGTRKAANLLLQSFLKNRASQYTYKLSKPLGSETFCSRLSAHLTYGTLSKREVYQAFNNYIHRYQDSSNKGLAKGLKACLSRLYWRCHFIQKLEDQPSIEWKCMHSAAELLRPQNPDPERLNAWYLGRTGYPLVDACMRYLHKYGWITFRMRALVMSFASYHLWLDWRATAPLLAQLFTDYEPGIHYSQVQMQSGVTGINALRIYDPIKQSYEHDPEGLFITTMIPELKKIPKLFWHEPWLSGNQHISAGYVDPLVNHALAVKQAKNAFSQMRKSPNYKKQAQKVYQRHGSRKTSKLKKEKDKQEGQLKLF